VLEAREEIASTSRSPDGWTTVGGDGPGGAYLVVGVREEEPYSADHYFYKGNVSASSRVPVSCT
jgi:hypothetical protein